MDKEDLIDCIEAATVKMEVMRHNDHERASPEWISFVDPGKLIEALREVKPPRTYEDG